MEQVWTECHQVNVKAPRGQIRTEKEQVTPTVNDEQSLIVALQNIKKEQSM